MLEELRRFAAVAYAREQTIQNTYDLCEAAIKNGLSGDFVECGVAAGAQIGIMGHVAVKFGSPKRVWAFDSYEGIPLAGPNDEDQPGIGALDPDRIVPDDLNELLVTSGISAHSLEQVKSHLLGWGLPLDKYVFVKGWFQDTISKAPINEISVLRLDGDLYESTKVCLEHLHHKVVKNGFVVIDDYALKGARQAVHEYLDKHELPYKPVAVYPDIPLPDKPDAHWYQIT